MIVALPDKIKLESPSEEPLQVKKQLLEYEYARPGSHESHSTRSQLSLFMFILTDDLNVESDAMMAAAMSASQGEERGRQQAASPGWASDCT